MQIRSFHVENRESCLLPASSLSGVACRSLLGNFGRTSSSRTRALLSYSEKCRSINTTEVQKFLYRTIHGNLVLQNHFQRRTIYTKLTFRVFGWSARLLAALPWWKSNNSDQRSCPNTREAGSRTFCWFPAFPSRFPFRTVQDPPRLVERTRAWILESK